MVLSITITFYSARHKSFEIGSSRNLQGALLFRRLKPAAAGYIVYLFLALTISKYT
jgi:hypothetical protein